MVDVRIFRVGVVVYIYREDRHHWKMLILVPTSRRRVDILSIGYNTDILILVFDV